MGTISALASLGSYLSDSTPYETSSKPASAQATGSSTTDFQDMTVSQIRDMTDQMALGGKLTGLQQLALIGDGLQDLEASNPAYQSNDGTGYSRTDAGTYDFVGMMNSAAEFAQEQHNSQTASVYQGIADAVQQYESDSTSSTVKASA